MTSRETYIDVVRTVGDWPAWTHTAIELVSEGGLVLLALAITVTVLARRTAGSLATAATGLAAVAVAYTTSALLKLAETQPRPCQTISGLERIAACPPPSDWSLPSNHAVLAAALAVVVGFLAPRLAVPAILLAVLVAASRVALGVHYPHDVVTGLSLGAGIAAALVLVLRARATRLAAAVGAVARLRGLA
jgi:undecaprenyl-diphosphatase